MKALQVTRSVGRSSGWPGSRRRWRRRRPRRSGRSTTSHDRRPRAARAPGWHRVHTRLAGICGSRPVARRGPRLARTSTTGSASRSCPATRSSATSTTARRVVLEPVLGHAARGFAPPFDGAAPGDGDDYAHLADRPPRAGHPDRLLLLDRRRLGAVVLGPRHRSSTASTTTCPTSGPCSSSRSPAASTPPCSPPPSAAGAARHRSDRRRARRRHDGPRRDRRPARATCPACGSSSAPATRTSSALAKALGADDVVPAAELRPGRAPRASAATSIGDHLSVGRPRHDRRRRQRALASPTCLRITRPRGRVVLMGMPAEVTRRPHRAVAPRDRARRAPTPTAPRRCPTARPRPHVRPRHRDRHRHRGRALAVAPPTASPTTSTPSPTPPPPAGAAPSRSPSTSMTITASFDRPTSETSASSEPDAPSRIRPRRRSLDATDPVLARRGLQPGEAAGRPQPGDLRARAAGRRSTTSTAPSATRCSTRSTRTRCRRCCSRA